MIELEGSALFNFNFHLLQAIFVFVNRFFIENAQPIHKQT